MSPGRRRARSISGSPSMQTRFADLKWVNYPTVNPQLHVRAEEWKAEARQAMVESRITAQRIPLRRDGEVHDARLALGDGQVEGVERRIRFSALALGYGERRW